jgi:hypothetical protein
VSPLNPFSCKVAISKVRVKFSPFVYKTLKIFNDFSRESHGHGGHEHGVRRGVFGDKRSFKKMSAQGVASVLCKKTPIFGSWRSKLDHLTVRGASVFFLSTRQYHNLINITHMTSCSRSILTFLASRVRYAGNAPQIKKLPRRRSPHSLFSRYV